MRVLSGLLLILLAACATSGPIISETRTPLQRATATAVQPGLVLDAALPSDTELPQMKARLAAIAAADTARVPIHMLADLDVAQQEAITLALEEPQVQQGLFTTDGQWLRNEIFGVYPLSPADLTARLASCAEGRCYRVEIYNYALNNTLLIIVDLKAKQTLEVQVMADTQPTIVPPHLHNLAAQIALASPDVRAELGLEPNEAMIQQPQMKVQFQATACERSRHLCMAPIFPWGERALWVIVDLVDYRIIGLRWTELGESSRRPISEQRLQDEVVTAQFCNQATQLERGGWSLEYMLTSSDGLQIQQVQFRGQPVLASAKLVDVHVSYSSREGFGYSDALGCPAFSAAAVVAWNGPSVIPIQRDDGIEGFALTQRFRSELWPMPCNYAYAQRYEFYSDGSFRTVIVNEGRGCGNDGTYRPILRLAFADSILGFAEWDGAQWQIWEQEGWQLQQENTMYTAEGYQYRLEGENGQGWFIEPGQGQFGDGGRGDNAYLYMSRAEPGRDEGTSDLPTLGDCCNTNEAQGPERFLMPPEPLKGGSLVLWYVPQLKNDDTPGAEYCWADARLEEGIFVPEIWPCSAGPLFVPLGGHP